MEKAWRKSACRESEVVDEGSSNWLYSNEAIGADGSEHGYRVSMYNTTGWREMRRPA